LRLTIQLRGFGEREMKKDLGMRLLERKCIYFFFFAAVFFFLAAMC
jgi:hypothetical protein